MLAMSGEEGFSTAAPATTISDSALFIQACKLYEAKNDSAAAELFFKLAKEFPNSERAPEALYFAGVLFYKEKMYPSALSAFRMYAEQSPDGKQINEALHWTGMCYYAMERYREAIEAFDEEISRFPNSQFRRDALKFMGISYIMIGDTARGNEILRKLVEERSDYYQPEYWFSRDI